MHVKFPAQVLTREFNERCADAQEVSMDTYLCTFLFCIEGMQSGAGEQAREETSSYTVLSPTSFVTLGTLTNLAIL